VQGYFFNIFSEEMFEPVGVQHLVKLDVPKGYQLLIYSLISGGVLLVLSLAFTGGAMFTKQPLVKSLFAVAMVVMFFVGYSYLVITYFGIEGYNPPERMMLVPLNEKSALTVISVALLTATTVMLFVAFRKLKEREV
jgi:hypothetical protein